MSFDYNLLYHPQQILPRSPQRIYQQPYSVHHLNQNLFEQTKSKVESLAENKTKIINWLKSISVLERQEKITFGSQDFVNLIKKIYDLRCYDNKFVYRLFQNYQNQKIEVSVKDGGVGFLAKLSTRAQEHLLQGIIFCHRQQPFDAITLKEQYLQNIEALFSQFSVIVDEIAFEITQKQCFRLQQEGVEKFFFQPQETPYYVQSLGKILVSVFVQQLCCQFYKAMRNQTSKKEKDKDKKKITNLWRDVSIVKKLEILQVHQFPFFIEKLNRQLNQKSRRFYKQVYHNGMSLHQVEQYLRTIVTYNYSSFYDRMRVITLNNSYRPDAQMGWFVLQKIKQFLMKKTEIIQIKSPNLFKKGKQKTKKQIVVQNQIKEKKKQPIPIVHMKNLKVKKQQKRLTIVSIVTNPIKNTEAQVVTLPQPILKNKISKGSKLQKQNNKKKKPKTRQISNLTNQINQLNQMNEMSEQDSKRQTSTSSPRISQISNQPKFLTSQSDVDVSQNQSISSTFSQKQHQSLFSELSSNQSKQQDQSILDGLNDKMYLEQSFQPTQHDYELRLNEIKELEKEILNQIIESYATKLKQHASKFQYSRTVAFNRLLYLLSPLGVTMNIFGSWATGFILKDSDIDLAISPLILNYFVSYFGTTKDKIASALHYIKSMIETKPWIKIIKLIDQAQVPVLKFTINTSMPFQESQQNFYNLPTNSIESIIPIDLTIQQFQSPQKNHVGLLVSSLINEWKERYPVISVVFLTIKNLLQINKMGDSYIGGISPHCLMIMLIAFLKHRNLAHSTNIGEVTLQFLHFYSQEFNFRCIGIDVVDQNNSPFFSKQQSQTVVIIEPVSKKMMKFSFSLLPKILQYFKQIRHLLLNSTQFLSQFIDPKIKIPKQLQYSNPLNQQYLNEQKGQDKIQTRSIGLTV